MLLSELPEHAERVLDLGSGDGRLLDLVLRARPGASGVAVDLSPPMLDAARARFAGRGDVDVVEHALDDPLPDLGSFDVVVSGFAIHDLVDERKRALYAEVLDRLRPGGLFANLEHVLAPTQALRDRFFAALGTTADREDASNKTLGLGPQLRWLRELGYVDVDCVWKWRELALLVGRRA